MIYSIGYDGGLTPQILARLLDQLGAGLVDVRSKPASRYAGFHGTTLAKQFGPRYLHAPDLGGMTTIEPRALDALQTTGSNGHILLMCKEHAPGDCHRHSKIAVPLLATFGVEVFHVFPEEARAWDDKVPAWIIPGEYLTREFSKDANGDESTVIPLEEHLKGRGRA